MVLTTSGIASNGRCLLDSIKNAVESNVLMGNRKGPTLVDLDDGARNHVVRGNLLGWGYIKFKGANFLAHQNVIVAYQSAQQMCLFVAQLHQRHGNFVYHGNQCFSEPSLNVHKYGWGSGARDSCKPPQLTVFNNRAFGVKLCFGSCASPITGWFRRSLDWNSTYTTSGTP